MSTCGAEAHLIAEGRVVGMLRCDLEAGHNVPSDRQRVCDFSESHEARIHWQDGEVIAEDDDDEPAVEVPFDEPPCQCGGDYPLDSWPGSEYGGHWDTCPARVKS